MKHGIYGLMLLWLTGCVSSMEKVNIKSEQAAVGGIQIVSNHPEVINTYVQPVNNQSVICLEPDPDFTSSFSGSLTLGASQGDDNEKIGGSEAASAVTAGGLSPLVLIARELLYRACELSMNSNANAQQQLAIYERFLQSIETISGAKSETGTQPQNFSDNQN